MNLWHFFPAVIFAVFWKCGWIYLLETFFACWKVDEKETRLPWKSYFIDLWNDGCISITPCTWVFGNMAEELLMSSEESIMFDRLKFLGLNLFSHL